MYARHLDSRGELRFGVSGKLWHGVLVLFDRETETLWTQLDGRAIEGELAGERLAHRPSVFTTFERWRTEHPDTEVLFKPEDERGQAESKYAEYFADPDRLFMPWLDEDLGGVGPKDVVFGVTRGGESLAVTEGLLSAAGSVQAVVGGDIVTFVHDEATESVRARVAPTLTGDVALGEELRVDRAYWYAWRRSKPASRVLAD